MTAIEAKLDALMNKLGNQDRRMHLAHKVETVEGSEQKSITKEKLAHEGPYQVEEAQFVGRNRSYNFRPNTNLPTHYTPTLRNHSHMEVEHNKAKDLCRIINSSMLHMGSRDSRVRELRIRAK